MTPTPEGAEQALKDAMTRRPRRRPPPHRSVGHQAKSPSSTRAATASWSQVPGVDDPEALKKLIGQTARLEFKLVDLRADPNQVAQGRAPAGSQVLPMADGSGPIAVQRRVMVSGEQVSRRQAGVRPADRRAGYHDQASTPPARAASPARPGECRQAVCHHPRQQGAVGAQHQRADPRRHRADQRQLHCRNAPTNSPSRWPRANCR